MYVIKIVYNKDKTMVVHLIGLLVACLLCCLVGKGVRLVDWLGGK